jgi:membrane dipeptidase
MLSIEARADELHRAAIVIDGHSDILIAVADGKMTLDQRPEIPDPEMWQPPPGITSIAAQFGFPAHAEFFGTMGQYDVPRWREGGITAQLCAIYIDDHQLDHAVERGLRMAWSLHNAVETIPDLDLITTADDITRVKREGKVGAVLTLEGFDAVGTDVRLLDLYYKLGLRAASLTHVRRNAYADGSFAADNAGGLTALGKQAIRRMNELGIVVDLVHIHEVGFWEILELTTAPVILSHSTSTMFPGTGEDASGVLGEHIPRPRLTLPRDRAMLEALARNGGVLGIIWFYKRDLDAVLEDIETALEVMGEDHVGIGSDLYGVQLAPRGLEHIGRLPAITRRLIERGHSDDVIVKILGNNYLRVFKQVWK